MAGRPSRAQGKGLWTNKDTEWGITVREETARLSPLC